MHQPGSLELHEHVSANNVVEHWTPMVCKPSSKTWQQVLQLCSTVPGHSMHGIIAAKLRHFHDVRAVWDLPFTVKAGQLERMDGKSVQFAQPNWYLVFLSGKQQANCAAHCRLTGPLRCA